MIRNTAKDAAPKQGSGLVHLMTALHQNASNIVNSNSQLNGPDQILPAEEFSSTKRNGCVKLRKDEHGLGSEEPISVPTLLQNIAENYPDVVALKIKRNDEWTSWTYERYLKEVNTVAKGFIHMGLHRHHSVAILGNNSPEWIVSDLAAIFSGGISVGLNIWLSSEEIAKICIDCKADIIVVQNEALLKKILLIQHKLPELRSIIQVEGEPPLSDKRRLHRTHKKIILAWEELAEIGQNVPDERLGDRLKKVAINQCCSIIYTSGSNDTPKGVMISHDNLTWCAKTSLGFIRAPGFNRMPAPGEEVLISVLPLSSISAQIIDIYYTLCVVGTLCISSDRDLLTQSDAFFDAVFDVQPTVLYAPTLLYERIYHKLRNLKRQMSGIQKMVLDWSSCTLRDKHLKDDNKIKAKRKLNQWQTALAKSTVTKKYKEMLGFSSRTVFFSRGAPMAREVLRFLAGYDILVHETFGQTENCGLLTANIPKRYCKLGTTGKPVPGIKMKIKPSNIETPFNEGLDAETGEIVCTGRNIFMGYLNKESETREVIPSEEQFLSLGDLGFINLDGFTVVIGKQDTFVTLTSGQILSPLRIEQLIRLELPCVSQALVIGDNQDYLTALLTLDTVVNQESGVPTSELSEDTKKWFRHSRFNVESVYDVIEHLDQGLHHVIQAGIDRVNQSARNTINMVSDWRIIHSQFTYQNGEIGLNGRLKRGAIVEKHKSCIQAMYGNKNDPGHCTGANASDEAVQVAVHPHSLTQIQEEDESRNCSAAASTCNDDSGVKETTKANTEEPEKTSSGENPPEDLEKKEESENEPMEDATKDKNKEDVNIEPSPSEEEITKHLTTIAIVESRSSSENSDIEDSSSEVSDYSEADITFTEESSRESSSVSSSDKDCSSNVSHRIIKTSGTTLIPVHEKVTRT